MSGSEPDELRAFVERLRALAKDENSRVRQSVAEAAPYLPEAVFQELVPALAEDRSPFVRDAAERAERKRSALRRSAAQENEHDGRVADLYREVEAHGARARTLAHRIASHETEYFVRRMVHEAGGSYMGLDEAARKLREGLEAPAIDRALLLAELDRIEERFAFFKHVLATGRSNARAEEPVLREENLGALVLDEVELLVTRFPERAAVLVVDTSGVDRSLVADIDAAFVREALANILKNAVEAHDAQSAAPVRIAVTVRGAPARDGRERSRSPTKGAGWTRARSNGRSFRSGARRRGGRGSGCSSRGGWRGRFMGESSRSRASAGRGRPSR